MGEAARLQPTPFSRRVTMKTFLLTASAWLLIAGGAFLFTEGAVDIWESHRAQTEIASNWDSKQAAMEQTASKSDGPVDPPDAHCQSPYRSSASSYDSEGRRGCAFVDTSPFHRALRRRGYRRSRSQARSRTSRRQRSTRSGRQLHHRGPSGHALQGPQGPSSRRRNSARPRRQQVSLQSGGTQHHRAPPIPHVCAPRATPNCT